MVTKSKSLRSSRPNADGLSLGVVSGTETAGEILETEPEKEPLPTVSVKISEIEATVLEVAGVYSQNISLDEFIKSAPRKLLVPAEIVELGDTQPPRELLV
jgi:hypothetical protein